MYYKTKAERKLHEQPMHKNRRQPRSLYDDPNILTPVYPTLTDKEHLWVTIRALVAPEIKVINLFK